MSRQLALMVFGCCAYDAAIGTTTTAMISASKIADIICI
jgi:hypothetical protein